MYELVDFCKDVENALRENPSWRAGQAYSNVLAQVRPDIAERILGTVVDPFYSNHTIPVFFHHVIDLW